MTRKKVLILGGSGMLGHKLAQRLPQHFDTLATVRKVSTPLRLVAPDVQWLEGVDADYEDTVANAIKRSAPDVVINCIGIVKQLREAKDPIKTLTINALMPHKIAKLTESSNFRLIHISTDCVFTGTRGNYTEDDLTDATDLYGRTKALGEVVAKEHCLTLRTSIIGRQLSSDYGLIEWFLKQQNGRVEGFKNAIFSGLTTVALSNVIVRLIEGDAGLHGLFNVASTPISKFDLLNIINETYDLHAKIDVNTNFHCNRALNGSLFTGTTKINIPDWSTMIGDLHRDEISYEKLRSNQVGVKR